MSQPEVVGGSRMQRFARIAQLGVVVAFLLSAPVLAVAAMQPWRGSALAAGVAVAPADDVVRNGLQIQEPVPIDVAQRANVKVGAQPRKLLLRTWSFTNGGGATGTHGATGANGSPGH